MPNLQNSISFFRFNLMAVVPDRRIAFTQKLNALELNQKRVKEAISKIGKHLRHLLAKTRDYNGNLIQFLLYPLHTYSPNVIPYMQIFCRARRD